jgi:glutathione S-transferase
MTAPVLFIGNKNYSSWSMRPWLALRWAGFAFEERVLQLGATGYGKSKVPDILGASPSGRVPALHVDGAAIHDSLAICEFAAETAAHLWPSDRIARARARALAAEMHSGFAALRAALPMNIRRRVAAQDWSADVRGDIARIVEMWSEARATAPHGPYLFGARTIADAFYAPVATRFRTYGVILPEPAQAYCDTLLRDDAFLDWERAAIAESWTIFEADMLYS